MNLDLMSSKHFVQALLINVRRWKKFVNFFFDLTVIKKVPRINFNNLFMQSIFILFFRGWHSNVDLKVEATEHNRNEGQVEF